MSDSRIDYQPLRAHAPDSPSHHRFPDSPDSPRHPTRPIDDDNDDDGLNASETQGLVGLHERDLIERLGQQQDHGHEDNDEAGHMGISNTQFSMLQSSLSLFPTLTPLVGGLLVERYGTGPSSIVFTTIVIIGQIIVLLGCWISSIKVMIAGFCLFGLGAAPITIIQETIWVRYFKKKGLALVMAMGLTIGKVTGFLGLATAVPLTSLPPFGFVTPFVVALAVSVVAWFMNIMFLVFQKKPREDADAMTKITILLKSKRTNLGLRQVYGFSTMLWTMFTISFLVGASWNPFLHQASNLVKHRYGLSDKEAAWESSVILAIPPVIYPFLGTFIDHAGKRGWLLMVNALLLIATYVVLMIPYSVVPIPPTVPMLLFSMSLAIGTLCLLTTVPILTKHVPTGLGLHRSIDNIGGTLFGTVAGMLQDSSRGRDDGDTGYFFDRLYHRFFPIPVDQAEQEHEDIQLLGMFLVVALAMLVACTVFVWGDYHWTDGEGGKTGLVNGVHNTGGHHHHDSNDSIQRNSRLGDNIRRRSTEVLRAMTMEPLFELGDELDAEEVSVAELGSQGHENQESPPATRRTPLETLDHRDLHQTGYDRQGRGQDHSRAEFLDDRVDGESQDETGEPRYGVHIESGDEEIPKHKIAQAHFWIGVWTVLLLTSWAVFAVGMSR
ncbi:hypothetical protein BGX31_001093 [Mortierella sp. GBA43]|nr:hypothetical protein BGX31_001093 [Mortierella sp. GBA43]